MKNTLITLKKGKNQSLDRRHPWIFSGAIYTDTKALANGAKVAVADSSGAIKATGHYSRGSIAVRILAFGEVALNQEFYAARISAAWQLRDRAGLTDIKGTNAFRLIHGEGDLLPGLIIDLYKDVAVIQSHSHGMAEDSQLIEAALLATAGDRIAHVLHKNADPGNEKISEGSDKDVVDIRENGLAFRINVATGQKTGFFIDQRENRELIRKYAKGAKMLNAFCYSGGFSIYALQAGAAAVHSLDSSAKAMGLVAENLDLNNLAGDRHTSMCTDAMEYLNSDEARDENYDLIVLDPPAFAKHRSARHRAVQAYKRLNLRALNILKPGGILFTFSCSQVVDPSLFNHTVAAAAMESGRTIRILRHLHQPEDHPVSIYHPEGEYLKGLVLSVD